MFSHEAHAAISRTRRSTRSGDTRRSDASSVSSASVRRPVADSALASDTSSTRRRSPSSPDRSGRTRSAAANSVAATAGARAAAWWAACSSTAAASASPGAAQRSRWCARAPIDPGRSASAAAARACASSRHASPGARVDGPAHQRVPERVAPRHGGAAEHAARDELVDRREGLVLREPGGRGGQLQLGGIARDGGPPGQPARGTAEAADLLRERDRHRPRHAGLLRRGDGPALRLAPRPRELLHVERVAAALPVDLVADGRGQVRSHQLIRVAARHLRQAELGHAALARGRLERGAEAGRDAAGAERQRDEDARARRAAEQVGDQLHRRVVGPVDVVEHEHDGPLGGELLQQRAHRPMRAEPLVVQPAEGDVAGRGRGRQHPRQLGHAVPDQPLEPGRAERGDVVVERGDPDAERQLALQLGAAPDEHEVPARLGLGAAARPAAGSCRSRARR